jgi:hypothetical protein
MLPSKAPNVYAPSRQLVNGEDVNNLTSQLNSIITGIVAAAGGGQPNAVQLNAAINVVATVANANDSVKLPVGFVGLKLTIINQSANNVAVFGYDANATVNGGASYAQATGAKTYFCVASGVWLAV